MSEGHDTPTSGRDHLDEAAEWHVELRHRSESGSPQSDPHLTQRWQQWSSDKEKQAAYGKIDSVLREVRNCPQPPLPSGAECAADEYDGSVSVEEWLAQDRHRENVVSPSPRVQWRRPWVPLAVFTVVAVVLAVVAGVVFLRIEPPHARPTDRVATYETGSGENREFLMPDGSTATLGAKTTLTAYYTDRRRLVVLSSGEGLFEVEHDPNRPFIVIAGPGAITAMGTSFNVLRESDRVVVTVINGTVNVAPHEPSMEDRGASEIRPSGSARSKSTRLTQGQKITYGEHGAASVVKSVDANTATAWRDGRLQYHEESLRHVIMDVNRYWRRQIIYDGGAGELLYTGDVLLDDIDAWVGKLHKIYAVEVVDTDPTHVLIRLNPEAAAQESR